MLRLIGIRFDLLAQASNVNAHDRAGLMLIGIIALHGGDQFTRRDDLIGMIH